MATQPSRAPQTLEESIVGMMELQSGCAKEAIIPPPSACPKGVHSMYAFSQSHALTIVIIAVFILALVQMTIIAINPNAGGH